MQRRPITRWFVWLVTLGFTIGGCNSGAMKRSPDNPLSASGLTPSAQDHDSGLVAVAPGFRVTNYRAIVVEAFDVTDTAIKDEDDRRLAENLSHHFQVRLVGQLRSSGLFRAVHEAGETRSAIEGPALRLRGVITRLGRGAQAARAFFGQYGAGAARAQADMHLVDAASNEVVVVISDRPESSYNPNRQGATPEYALMDCFNHIARDLGRFLVRLSKDQARAGVR